MKKQYTAFDLGAYFFTGLITMAFIWIVCGSYAKATQMGYTPEARAHMDYLAEIYNGERETPTDPIALHVEYLGYLND